MLKGKKRQKKKRVLSQKEKSIFFSLLPQKLRISHLSENELIYERGHRREITPTLLSTPGALGPSLPHHFIFLNASGPLFGKRWQRDRKIKGWGGGKKRKSKQEIVSGRNRERGVMEWDETGTWWLDIRSCFEIGADGGCYDGQNVVIAPLRDECEAKEHGRQIYRSYAAVKGKEQLGTGYLACKQHPVAYKVYKKKMLRCFQISLQRSLQQLFAWMFWGQHQLWNSVENR